MRRGRGADPNADQSQIAARERARTRAGEGRGRATSTDGSLRDSSTLEGNFSLANDFLPISPLKLNLQTNNYRDEIYSLQILLSRTQAGPGKTVKQEQEEISPNHVQRLNLTSVLERKGPKNGDEEDSLDQAVQQMRGKKLQLGKHVYHVYYL